MSLLEELILPENLAWAWRKAKFLYQSYDGLANPIEVAAFELNLQHELDRIIADFKDGSYLPAPLLFLPQPKKRSEQGAPRFRPSYAISVRDQVASIALVNVIGPRLDAKMPKWSYGHRLYRTAWLDDEAPNRLSKLQIGPYRHSTGRLFRPFKQSWPLYRRHVVLTARIMGVGRTDIRAEDLDVGEEDVLRFDGQSFDEGRLEYLQDRYWKGKAKKIFYATLDLKTFYPSLRIEAIEDAISLHCDDLSAEPGFQHLVSRALTFKVSDVLSSRRTLEQCDPPFQFDDAIGIPTGLMTAGFFANAAMLPVDQSVSSTSQDFQVAHFRFVDDHTILTTSPEKLVEWVRWYEGRIEDSGIGPKLNVEKTEPTALREILGLTASPSDTDSGLLQELRLSSQIDPHYPTPLLTKTLSQLSLLAAADFDLLDEKDQLSRLQQLEMLLLAEFPETEIRGQTRVSFAASRLAYMVPRLRDGLVDSVTALERETRLADKNLRLALQSKKKEVDVSEALQQLNKLRAEFDSKAKASEEASHKTLRRYFSLLRQAADKYRERPRLIQRLVDFCQHTGFSGVSVIRDWLISLVTEDPRWRPTVDYLQAILLQSLSRSILQSVGIASDKDTFQASRKHAREFIQHCIDLDLIQSSSKDNEPYLDHATREFIFARSVSFIVLNMIGPEAQLPGSLKLFAKDRIFTNIESLRDWCTSTTPHSLSEWAYWASELSFPLRNDFFVWRTLTPFLGADSQSDLAALRLFPNSMTPKQLSNFLGQPNLPDDDDGLLYEVAGVPLKGPLFSEARNLQRSVLKRLGQSPKGTLLEWISESENIHSRNPFDPRASEWTALAVTAKVIQALQQVDLDLWDDPSALHPVNFEMGAGWLNSNSTDLSATGGEWGWEAWRNAIQTPEFNISISSKLLKDYRRQQSGHDEKSPQNTLFGLGLLLVALIRRSSALPRKWNLRGHSLVFPELALGLLEFSSVSFLTTSILEGLLQPRPRETILLDRFPDLFKPEADRLWYSVDTSFDAPEIFDVDDLLTRIIEAQSALQRGQLTIDEHQPRQLIPVAIRRIQQIELGAEDVDN